MSFIISVLIIHIWSQNMFALVQLVHFTHTFITHMPKEKLGSELCYWIKYSVGILVGKGTLNMAYNFLLNTFQRLKHMSLNTFCQSVLFVFTEIGICHLKTEHKNHSSRLHKIMDCTSSLCLHFSKLFHFFDKVHTNLRFFRMTPLHVTL